MAQGELVVGGSNDAHLANRVKGRLRADVKHCREGPERTTGEPVAAAQGGTDAVSFDTGQPTLAGIERITLIP